jgi:hypothetical protein
MVALPNSRGSVADSMLTCLDLTQFQPRNRCAVDQPIECGRFQRIDIKSPAQIGQGI